jgi:hypothetical protein
MQHRERTQATLKIVAMTAEGCVMKEFLNILLNAYSVAPS